MSGMFPFPGRRLEILSSEGVRYRGSLTKVDSSSKSITLVNVHHYGTEDRDVAGQLPKQAKGALPEGEERVFFAEWISSVRVIWEEGDVAATTRARKRPATEVAEPSSSKSARLDNALGTDDAKVESGRPIGQSLSERELAATPRRRIRALRPLYFVSQLLQSKAYAVLLNADECASDVPAYMRLHIDSLPVPPVPTQVWEVHSFQWIKENRRVVPHMYGTGRDGALKEFAAQHGGMPWMRDHYIVAQAQATHARLKCDVERRRDRAGRIKSIRRKLEKPHQLEVEVDDGSCVGTYLLDRTHFAGTDAQFEKLAEEDAIEVELIRLPEGCRVGPKYVLPNIDYHRDKPPFEPESADGAGLTVSRRGDYLPWKFKMQRGSDETEDPASEGLPSSSRRSRNRSWSRARMGDRGAESRLSEGELVSPLGRNEQHAERSTHPLYFICQRKDSNAALAMIMNRKECPSDPVYLRLLVNSLPSPPIPTQVWRVRRYTWEEGDARNAGTRWMIDQTIVAHAEALTAELVRDVEARTERKGKVRSRAGRRANNDCVEVTAKGAVDGCLLGAQQYDGTEADFGRLRAGDEVRVEMIRLPEGCWVGGKYVLPCIDYHRNRAPFEPDVRGEMLVRSRKGDYLPWRIKLTKSNNDQ